MEENKGILTHKDFAKCMLCKSLAKLKKRKKTTKFFRKKCKKV